MNSIIRRGKSFAVHVLLALIYYYIWERGLVFNCLLLLVNSCSQDKKDAGVKELLVSTGKQEVAFAGVGYVVKDGVVILTSNAPSESDRQKVEEKAKSVSDGRT